MAKANKDFEELLEFLSRRGVKALIVGAHAVAFYAKPRYTKDIDIFIEPSVENAERLLEALDDFGFGSLDLEVADFSTPGKIVQLGVEPNRVDFITSIGDVDFAQAWDSKKPGRYGGGLLHRIGGSQAGQGSGRTTARFGGSRVAAGSRRGRWIESEPSS